MAGIDNRRGALLRAKALIDHHERKGQGALGTELMRGARYELAVDATDVNGDGCMYPACGCPEADCAIPRDFAPKLGAPWDPT